MSGMQQFELLTRQGLDAIAEDLEQRVASDAQAAAAARDAALPAAEQASIDAQTASQEASAANAARLAAEAAALVLGATPYPTRQDMLLVEGSSDEKAYVYADASPSQNGLYFWDDSTWVKDALDAQARLTQAQADIDAERDVRRSVFAPDAVSGYLIAFLSRSMSNPRLSRLLGGFRGDDGALEVSAIRVRNLLGRAQPSRWVGWIASDAGQKMLAFDYRGRFRGQPDEATISYIAERMPGLGQANSHPMLPMSGGEFHRPVDHVIGLSAYGQSWEARNGQGAPAQNAVNGFTITGAKFPRNVVTLADGKGFLGWEGPSPASHSGASDYIAGQEVVTQIQTPTGAAAFRMGQEATQQGIPQAIWARSEARGETAIEALMPLIAEFPEAVDGGPWNAWERSIINAQAIAQAKGTRFVLHFIAWTHGQSNIDDSYSSYMDKLTRLLNHMQARAMAITGQETAPHLLVTQHPSSTTRGYSETFKVVSDFCRTRSDATLVAAGYGHDMIDVVHWNRWGAVEVGELRAIAAGMRLRGLPWGSPQLANPRRSGDRSFVFDVIGAHDVIVDESIVSDRHQIGGTYDAATGVYSGGTPVPFHGFEASQGSSLLTIESVTVERRRITVTLTSAPASGTVQIRYAMHNNMVNTSARGDGRAANRGTIRADWGVASMLRPTRTLRRWLASDYFNFTI